jgi:hypothetical protein
MKIIKLLFMFVAVAGLSGCASYIVPGPRADFSAFGSASMRENLASKPAAHFPAGLAAVRVQSPTYHSYFADQEGSVYGGGRYSVILTREVEDDADMVRISNLPDVAGLISMSRLLLPPRFESDRDLREAAARLKADMLLIYTFDTSFHKNDASTSLNMITLGLSPTRRITVHVTASALLMDTRTGYIYAAYDSNEKRDVQTNMWESRETADRARQSAERAAFKKLAGEFEKNWPGVVERAKRGG